MTAKTVLLLTSAAVAAVMACTVAVAVADGIYNGQQHGDTAENGHLNRKAKQR